MKENNYYNLRIKDSKEKLQAYQNRKDVCNTFGQIDKQKKDDMFNFSMAFVKTYLQNKTNYNIFRIEDVIIDRAENNSISIYIVSNACGLLIGYKGLDIEYFKKALKELFETDDLSINLIENPHSFSENVLSIIGYRNI